MPTDEPRSAAVGHRRGRQGKPQAKINAELRKKQTARAKLKKFILRARTFEAKGGLLDPLTLSLVQQCEREFDRRVQR